MSHRLSGCGRDAAGIAELAKGFGAPHRFEVVDVACRRQVARWAQAHLAALGPPHLLINNAGLINVPRPLWQVPAAEISSVLDVNLKGVIWVIQELLPAMMAEGAGVVVNMSPGWGRSVAPEVAPYVASKWAIEGLTQALAQELPAGLAAIAVNPGIIHTDMLDVAFGESAGQFPGPRQWAKAAAPWLLSLGPRHNGQALTAPGG